MTRFNLAASFVLDVILHNYHYITDVYNNFLWFRFSLLIAILYFTQEAQ